MSEDLRSMINNNEKIKWEGKPDKKCYLFEAIFNPLLPFAILWGLIDFSIIGFGFESAMKEGSALLYFLVPFFLLHLMPVWIYLGGVLLSRKKYKNTYYVVTDKGIYVSGGIITKNIITKPFAEMSHINLHRGFFDQRFGVKREDLFQLHTYIGQYGNDVNIRGCGFIYPISESKWNQLKLDKTQGVVSDIIYQQSKKIAFHVVFLKIPDNNNSEFPQLMKKECDNFIQSLRNEIFGQ